MITGLKLENWKSHSDSEFEFGKGTNVLVGVMGSGKSSVLSAISFALFGTFPSHRSREVTLDDIIMNRPQKKEEAKVKLEFEIGGQEFEIERVIARGKGTKEASIRKGGELLDTGPSRVTELVEKYLKVDYNLFSRAVYAEQDGLDNFLEIRKGERMKKIDDLLQIDRFEECRSNVTTLTNRMEERIKSKKKTVEEMEEQEDFSKIEELEEEIGEIKEEMEELEEKLERLDEEYQERKEEIEELREGLDEIKKLENRKSTIKGSISSLEDDIESLKDEAEFSEEEVDEKLEKKEKELKELENEKEAIKEDLDDLEDKQKDRKIRIKEIQKKIQKIKGVEGKCPVCDKELDEDHKKELLEERREKVSKLAEEKEKLESRIEEKETKLKEINENKEDLKEEKRSLERKKESLDKLEEKKEDLKEKKEKLQNISEELEEKQEKFDREKIEEKQERVNEISGERERIKERAENKKEIMEERKGEKEKLEERKERFEKYKEEIKSSEGLIEDLKKFKSALSSTQEQLRTKFIEAVNSTLTKVWGSLYPYDDFSDLRFTIKEGDYELQFKNKGSWQSVEGIASGGERTSACLALRIAFALVLAPNLRWLVLDEPTHNLDRQAVKDLSELLRTSVSEFVDQVFLITHNETMENAASSHLYKLNRDKHRDEPTEVEEIT